jgi:hypothetical protein
MMVWVLARTTPVAGKAYACDASRFMRGYLGEECWGDDWFTAEEQAQLAAAEKQNWMILPGQQYVRVVYVDNGIFYTFRAIPAVDAICNKHELYPED